MNAANETAGNGHVDHDDSVAQGERAEWGPLGDDHSFALCLTHDLDRPYKTYQALYYGLKHFDLDELHSWWRGDNPYWQFETIMQLEDELGVRSSFNILNEQRLLHDKPIREWFSLDNWKLYAGRYSLEDPAIVDVIKDLDAGGWEIALHGSYESYDDRERLRYEREALESVLGHEITGGRQHYLNLNVPRTWKHHRAIGLQYDTTLGSNDSYGFQYGYEPYRPFDDAFVVFPLTVMEFTLPNVCGDPEGAWRELERLLEEARENHAVMTVLWHPRYFSDEHPNYADLYRRLIARALEMDAWVGPPGALYERLDHPPEAAVAERTDSRLRQRRHA